jgi:hypothetical protein
MRKDAIEKLNEIDWEKIASFGLTNDEEPTNLINMLNYNQKGILVTLGTLVEQMVNHICKSSDLGIEKNLINNMEKLKESGAIPEAQLIAMHSIRKARNEKLHGKNEIKDVESYVLGNLLLFVDVTKWFLENYVNM